MIDYDEIRKEVAIEHNFLLAKDDPVLVTVTLNRLVLQHYVDILVERNMELLKALEAAQQKGISDAKITAGSVITQATGYAKEEIGESVKKMLDEFETRNKSKAHETEEMKKAANNTMTYGLYGLVTLGAFVAGLAFLYFIKN